MRKILIIAIIILLAALACTSVANGLQIGDLEIYSIQKLQEENDKINSRIEEINKLKDTTYNDKMDSLKKASSDMNSTRSKYLEYTSLSSDSEILAAMQGKSYKLEFLWATIGTHARNEQINLKLEVANSSIGATNANDLEFTINGTYINIINFVYALENDADLNFKISNFKLVPKDGSGILEGTFTVTNIKIEENKTADSSFESVNAVETTTVDATPSVVPTADQTSETNKVNPAVEASSSAANTSNTATTNNGNN